MNWQTTGHPDEFEPTLVKIHDERNNEDFYRVAYIYQYADGGTDWLDEWDQRTFENKYQKVVAWCKIE